MFINLIININTLVFTDCHDVYKHGGLRFDGDYYIKIQPRKSKEPFKVVCKSIDNTGGNFIFFKKCVLTYNSFAYRTKSREV